MPPRIAIPMPHSADHEYGERALPQYERAVALAGGEPVRIPLDRSSSAVRAMIANCDGVLLPGSNADVDPARFQQGKSPHTANADMKREAVDDLLLEDAYVHRKPVLGICYGLQSLNVFLKGSLIQHIPDFLPEQTRTKVNHEAGKKVAVAHSVFIEPSSKLSQFIGNHRGTAVLDTNREGHGLGRADQDNWRGEALPSGDPPLIVPVNSSHHQSADATGEGLRIVARCPDDSIIEALEGTSADHFVLAVQWHPERSTEDPASRSIFRALVEAAGKK